MNQLEKVLDRFEKYLDFVDDAASFGELQQIYNSIEDELIFLKELKQEAKYLRENPYDILYGLEKQKYIEGQKPKFRRYAIVRRAKEGFRKSEVRETPLVQFSRF